MTQYTTQRVMRWRLLLEEYGPTFLYKTGESNYIADALSRVPTARTERESTEDRAMFFNAKDRQDLQDRQDPQDYGQNAKYNMILDDVEMTDCLLVYPKFDIQGRHPFHFTTMRYYQQKDDAVRQLVQTDPGNYMMQRLGDAELVCRRNGNNFQIVLTDEMMPRLVRWYQHVTAHAEGMERLEQSIKRRFYHRGLHDEIRRVVKGCDVCQKMKPGYKQFGQLAPREALATPWQEVHTDTIGPWEITLAGGKTLMFHAQTNVDP